MASNENKMSGATFRTRFGSSVGVTYAGAVACIGLSILIFFMVAQDHRNLSRFQHDFFAAVSSNEEAMRYGRNDAKRIAMTLRVIPAGRIDQDFSDMLALALVEYASDVKRVSNELAIADFSKSERLALYSDFMGVEDWRDTFLNVQTRLAVKRVLQGGAAPQIEGADRKLILPFDYWVPWILLVQFIAFGVYAVACRFASGFSGSCDNYNPLFGLPKGMGSKVALLITVPGSLPLMLLVLLFSTPSRIQARTGQGRAKAKRFAPVAADSFSSQSSRDRFERLTKRVGGR